MFRCYYAECSATLFDKEINISRAHALNIALLLLLSKYRFTLKQRHQRLRMEHEEDHRP